MANEKRLIDANALTKLLELLARNEDYWKRNTILGVVRTIQTRPTVDAVEVVRCKDCKKWDPKTGACEEFTTHRFPEGGRVAFLTRETDFCSYGERRADA